MSRLTMVHAVLVAAAVFGLSLAGSANAQQVITIDAAALDTAGCFGQPACTVEGVQLAASSPNVLAKKTLNGASGFGVSGGASGNEIDIGETLGVAIGAARNVRSIQFLFLFNGPEFGDRAEVASVVVDGTTTYTLAVSSTADNVAAWSGPGTVTNCGATTAAGTGCFIVTDPFPEAVSELEFGAAAGGTPFGGAGNSNSDYSIGSIAIDTQIIVELQNCGGPQGCPITNGFSFNSMNASNSSGSTQAVVIPVTLPDCRYIPRTCLDQLGLDGATPATEDAARAALIDLDVILSLDSGPNKLHPAAQLLNVTPLLPAEVTSLFEPTGLPRLYIGSRWKAQSVNLHWFDAYFFKTDSGLQFTNVFEGLIDVSELTGDELGCFPDLNDLLAWDVITTASELAKSVSGRYIDTILNTGCINPTKVSGTRLSLYSINLEMAKDTYGPTITSKKPKVTENNDAVFARLVASLWKDLGDIRANYACKQADPVPSGGQAPLAPALCKTLASLWSQTDRKVVACVDATFNPITGYAYGICQQARDYVDGFKAALPATTSRPDPYNRLGELHGRVAAFKHVWDDRFLPSIDLAGFCRERGTCAP
ncbi:MAG: hypothetical protein M3O07_04165 [Pseudomonadota bacterium]|nr:hypothetical protein [Pseudomonadota bacterium]